MRESKFQGFNFRKIGYRGGLLLTLLMAAAMSASSQDDKKIETIDATAMGTSTQLGHTVSIKVIISQYSTPEDRQVLVDAFQEGPTSGSG
jgi:hypothetical protein